MLEYELNSTGDGYNAMRETDDTVSKIIVPDMYNGLPVTGVNISLETLTNLKEIVLGNNVKITYFGSLNSESLEKIYLGRSIETISGPFTECKNLSDIYFSASEEEWKNINLVAIDDSDEMFLNATVHFGVLGQGGILTFEEETIFPYTHWDCVKGKPNNISAAKVTFDNSVSGLKAENVKDAIDELNARNFDASSLESWDELKYLVRSGRAADFIKIGDEFVCHKNGKELIWNVIGIDVDVPADESFTHSITLQLSECYVNMPFSVPEASFYLFTPLDAGQYYIPLKNYTSESDFCAFTLPEKVQADCLIRVSENKVYIYRKRNQLPYLTLDVDLFSKVEAEMPGTKIRGSNFRINSEMGTVDYSRSDVREWLNSTEVNWWREQSLLSLTPIDYLNVPGFANGIDEDFLNAINPVKKTTVLPDGTEIETTDKFFLLSDEEVYVSGTKHYPYYKDNSTMPAPDTDADAIRIKNLNGSPRHWWLRNPAEGDDGYMRALTDGSVGSVKAAKVLAYGVAPACCIC